MGGESSPLDDVTRNFVAKLKEARQASAGRSEPEIQEALRQALRDGLSGMSEIESDRVLESARASLIAEARKRDQRVESLESEVRQLRSETEALRSERDRLAREAKRPTSGAPGLSEDTLNRFREGLRKATHHRSVDPDSIGLQHSETGLFMLVRELLVFALNFETGVHDLLCDIEVWGAGQDTLARRKQKKIIENRFRACLDNEEGSIQALKETLKKNARFLLQLHGAYSAALKEGARSLLGDFDPQPIVENCQRARLGGLNHERAWTAFLNQYTEIESLPWADTWKRYFEEPFKGQLVGYLERA